MSKIQKLMAVLFISAITMAATAQQKYALLTGINNYYKNTGEIYTTVSGAASATCTFMQQAEFQITGRKIICGDDFL